MNGAVVFLTAFFAIVGIIVLAGLDDLILWLRSEQTITAWLRLNPEWFFGPALVMMVFISWLACHLFAPEGMRP
jgi:hypothetical protein